MASQRDARDGVDLPDSFFLPPETDADLWRETRRLLTLCLAFVVVLAIAVVATRGVVIVL